MVLAQERRDAILRALLPSGAATVAALADALGVSEMTIRRDLGVLAGQRLVEKVHGGAVLSRRGAAEPTSSPSAASTPPPRRPSPRRPRPWWPTA